MLYCTLTGQLMDKSMQAVKTHEGGKKYLYNKGEWAGTRVLTTGTHKERGSTGGQEAWRLTLEEARSVRDVTTGGRAVG